MLNNKLLYSSLLLILVIFLCGGCGWITGHVDDEEVQAMDNSMTAVKRKTAYDESLKRFGHMLIAYNIDPTAIQSQNITNATESKQLPGQVYTLVASTINKIGKPLTFIPYDVPYIVAETSLGGKIQRIYPKFVISGAMTGFNKDMIAKERVGEGEGGWAGARGGARYKSGDNISRITIDLNMRDYITQAYIPGVHTGNALSVHKSHLGWGVFGYYMGNGGSFDYNYKLRQGIHAAIRTIIEFSVIELLGKLFVIPYWRSFPGALPDDQMIEKVYNDFKDLAENEQQSKIKMLLYLHGYEGIDLSTKKLNRGELQSVSEAMSKYNCSSMAKLYLNLWESVPIDAAAQRAEVYRRMQRRTERQQQLEAQKTAEAKRQRNVRIQQQQKKLLDKKISQYNDFIKKASDLFVKKQYMEARALYLQANRLFPQQEYPARKIRQINAHLQAVAREKARFEELLNQSDSLYQTAEKQNFAMNACKQALASYQKALQLKPDNGHIKSRITMLNKKLEKYQPGFKLNTRDEKW